MKPQIRRHEKITALVREHGFMSVEQLARELEVTPQTIRRDIGILSAENVLRRYHGGAALGDVLLEGEFGQGGRHSRREEKNAIAQLIAAHIPDNASLFISIGTTMEAVAAALIKQRKNLRIITNNIYVAALASARSDYTVIITSGVVRPLDGGVTGVATVDFINQFKVDYAVLSPHGVEGDGVDHSKFQSHALVRLGDITDFDRVFTDRAPDGEMQKILTAAGVEWLVPEICQHATETAKDEK